MALQATAPSLAPMERLQATPGLRMASSAGESGAGESSAGESGAGRELCAMLAWTGVLAGAIVWGDALNDSGAMIGLHAAPLVGEPGLSLSTWIVPAAVVAAAVVAFGPALAAALRWRLLLLASAGATAAWAAALSAVRGPDSLLEPVRWPTEYLGEVGKVGHIGSFLSHFTTRISEYTVHVRGHPPGMLLVLVGLDRIGLSGSGPAAALILLAGALAAPAALVALREVAGASLARSAAPFLILAPAAVWIATSADALFAGVGAWSVALIVLATGRAGRRAELLALAGGLLFGATLMLSYGLVLLGVVPLGVIVARRSTRVGLIALASASAVLAAFALAGFWWIDGLLATRDQYLAGIASDRPYGYFLLSNLAAFGLVIGPATVAALSRLRSRGAWLLVGGATAAVALAELSGMSKGEVERIWLPFAPWIVLAGCVLAVRGHAVRAWLGAQALTGLAIVLVVHTHW